MVNHWDRPGWAGGRQAYYWYLTFDAPELIELAEICQEKVKAPYLDPVPLNGLHLTLSKVGWTDTVLDEQLDEIAETARGLCSDVERFSLIVGPLAGSPGAVRFSVSPWQPVLSLNDRLVAATRSVVEYRATGAKFRPHIGIAYSNAHMAPDPVVHKVAQLRSLPPVKAEVNQVKLVQLRTEKKAYVWSTAATIPLI